MGSLDLKVKADSPLNYLSDNCCTLFLAQFLRFALKARASRIEVIVFTLTTREEVMDPARHGERDMEKE